MVPDISTREGYPESSVQVCNMPAFFGRDSFLSKVDLPQAYRGFRTPKTIFLYTIKKNLTTLFCLIPIMQQALSGYHAN